MAQQDSLQFCPNCGAKLKPGAVFCGNCGFNIANYKASKKNAGNESQTSQPGSASAAPKSGNRFNQPNQPGSQSNSVRHRLPLNQNHQLSVQHQREELKKQKNGRGLRPPLCLLS